MRWESISQFIRAGTLAVAAVSIPSLAFGQTAAPAQAAAPASPPLPFHTIEGYGGGAITPLAYVVNPAVNKNDIAGLPSVAFSYVGLGQKDLQALTFTETLFGRLELGYGVDRLGLGKLPDDIQAAATVDIDHDQVYLHNLNARFLVIEEGSLGQYTPAVTVGAHLKYNDGIDSINDRLGGALTGIGYDEQWGTDFTLTATKAFPDVFGRPLILTAGVRFSEAAQLGTLGFSDGYTPSVEGSIIYLPTDWLLIAAEVRQKTSPYDEIPGLIGPEDTWFALDASWIINSNSTLVLGYGYFGNLANADANAAWWLQYKYEF